MADDVCVRVVSVGGPVCVGGRAGPFNCLCESDDRSTSTGLVVVAAAETFVAAGPCKHDVMPLLPASVDGLLAVLGMSGHSRLSRLCLLSRHCLASVDCLAEFKSRCLDADADADADASDNMVTDSLTSSEHRLILRSMSSVTSDTWTHRQTHTHTHWSCDDIININKILHNYQ